MSIGDKILNRALESVASLFLLEMGDLPTSPSLYVLLVLAHGEVPYTALEIQFTLLDQLNRQFYISDRDLARYLGRLARRRMIRRDVRGAEPTYELTDLGRRVIDQASGRVAALVDTM